MFINQNAVNILKSKNYKESTIITLDYNVKRIFKDAGFGNNYIAVKLQDYNKIIDTIKSYPVKQQKQYIYTIIILFQHGKFNKNKDFILKKYTDFFDSVSEARNNLLTIQQPVNNVDTNSIMRNIKQFFNTYTNEFNNNPNKSIAIKYLILALYLYLPPLRPQNYINAIFKQYSDTPGYNKMNIIDLDNGLFLIREGKTLRSGQTITIKLSNDIVNIIKEAHMYIESKFLIPMFTEDKPMTQKQFTQVFKDITNGLTPTLLRNVFVSKYIDIHGIENTQKRQQLARIMGHTVQTQNNIYSKYSTLLHP